MLVTHVIFKNSIDNCTDTIFTFETDMENNDVENTNAEVTQTIKHVIVWVLRTGGRCLDVSSSLSNTLDCPIKL